MLLVIPVSNLLFPRANVSVEYFPLFCTRKLVLEVREEWKILRMDEWIDGGTFSIHLGCDSIEFLSHRKGH